MTPLHFVLFFLGFGIVAYCVFGLMKIEDDWNIKILRR